MARVYSHEFVDVVGTARAKYQHHMTANWCPEAGPLRRQSCFGVFSVVGSTGRWPQVVNLWEYDGWEALAHNSVSRVCVCWRIDVAVATPTTKCVQGQ